LKGRDEIFYQQGKEEQEVFNGKHRFSGFFRESSKLLRRRQALL